MFGLKISIKKYMFIINSYCKAIYTKKLCHKNSSGVTFAHLVLAKQRRADDMLHAIS